jgi:hypothetical protein
MPNHALHCLVFACALLAAASARADPLSDGSCVLPGDGRDPLADRAGLLAQYERLPPACLQELVLACTAVTNRAMLDFGSAAVCSLGYEALLSRRFGGNFQALLAWWNSKRTATLQ